MRGPRDRLRPSRRSVLVVQLCFSFCVVSRLSCLSCCSRPVARRSFESPHLTWFSLLCSCSVVVFVLNFCKGRARLAATPLFFAHARESATRCYSLSFFAHALHFIFSITITPLLALLVGPLLVLATCYYSVDALLLLLDLLRTPPPTTHHTTLRRAAGLISHSSVRDVNISETET